MTKEDCRANALKCYRVAQKAADRDVRRTLLALAVQWRELATQIERLQRLQRKMLRRPLYRADAQRCIRADGTSETDGFRHQLNL